MPERWERELGKLGREEMPAGVRVRAEEGPRAESMPPPRQRAVAAGVAFAVFLAAGAFAFQALRPIGGGRLAGDPSEPMLTDATVTFHESDLEYNPDLPYAELMVNGMTVRGQFDSLSWRNADIDTDRPTYVDPLSFPLGSRVVIAGDADAVAGTFADPSTRDPIQDLPLTDLDGYVMAEPGEYFLVFEAKWAPDVVPFYFPIKVRPVEPDLTDADAELSITAYPFEAVMTYGGQRSAIQELDGSWTTEDGKAQETHGLFSGIAEWARLQIPVGTPLQISGNWEDWRNHLEPGGGRVTPNDQGALAFPSSAGTFNWRMTAAWPQGEAEFVFGVELLDRGLDSPAQSPSSTPADNSSLASVSLEIHGLDGSAGRPVAVALFGAQREEGCVQWFEWQQLDGTIETGGGNLACDEVQLDLELVAGKAIELSGDFADAQIHFNWPDTGQLEVDHVPKEAVGRGISIMIIEVQWPQGQATFIFWVEVVKADGG